MKNGPYELVIAPDNYPLLKSVLKTRLKFRKYNKVFCSSKCGAKHKQEI